MQEKSFFGAAVLLAGLWAISPAAAKTFVRISESSPYWIDMDSRELRTDGRVYFCGAYKEELPDQCDESGQLNEAMDCASRHFYTYAPDPADDDSPRIWQQDDSQVVNGNLYALVCEK